VLKVSSIRIKKRKKKNILNSKTHQSFGEGSSSRNSSARKNCSTPKSQLLDTVRADDKKNETAQKKPKKSFRPDEFFRPK
jgi:hypothetical protein